MPDNYKIIAIDPGTKMNGVCRYENGKFVGFISLKHYQLHQYILKYENHIFLIENSNLVKANWHGKTARARVGKNQQASQSIVDFCKDHGIVYEELKPDGYSMHYKNADNKYSPFCQKLFLAETGWTGQTNEHERAAAAMVLRYVQKRKLREKIRNKRP